MMNTLGDRLKILRRSKNLTQSDVAKKVGVTRSAVGYYEIDRNIPPMETLVRLARIYNVSTDYLLTGQSNVDDGDADNEITRGKMSILEIIRLESGSNTGEPIEITHLSKDYLLEVLQECAAMLPKPQVGIIAQLAVILAEQQQQMNMSESGGCQVNGSR